MFIYTMCAVCMCECKHTFSGMQVEVKKTQTTSVKWSSFHLSKEGVSLLVAAAHGTGPGASRDSLVSLSS